MFFYCEPNGYICVYGLILSTCSIGVIATYTVGQLYSLQQ